HQKPYPPPGHAPVDQPFLVHVEAPPQATQARRGPLDQRACTERLRSPMRPFRKIFARLSKTRPFVRRCNRRADRPLDERGNTPMIRSTLVATTIALAGPGIAMAQSGPV